MKKLILVVALVVSANISNAQDSEKAKALLDDVYSKITAYENIFVDFKYVLNNVEADINQETRGNVTLKGEKYLFDIFGTQQLYDGKKVYTIVPENEEVTLKINLKMKIRLPQQRC